MPHYSEIKFGDLHLIDHSDGTFYLGEAFEAEIDGELTCIPAGFQTDLVTSPGMKTWLRASKAAVLHDWHCRYKTVTRKEADRIFLSSLKSLGFGWTLRHTMYSAVRMWAWIS